jgi:hypothetical protein
LIIVGPNLTDADGKTACGDHGLNKIARMAWNERTELFDETAARKGIADAIVEKDFWVCWALKQLFSIEALSGRLLFKGGTSLSKIFHAINRFSEDIDLPVDYVALGFTGELDPRRADISKTRRAAIFAEIVIRVSANIGGEFLVACGDGPRKSSASDSRAARAFEIKCRSLLMAVLCHSLIDFRQRSARSRNHSKDVRPILLNNAGPDALHSQ